MSADIPHRRYTMKIIIGADSVEDALVLLDDFREGIESGSTHRVTGGSSFGGQFTVTKDESVTHESYFKAVDKWKKEQQ